MSQTFKKHKEDFICSHCDTPVTGTGYTNHCPNCLYSKHVDVFPGDRSNPCGGLMQPIGSETKRGEVRIIHQCIKCGTTKPCVASPSDNLSAVQQGLSLRTRKVSP